jgi:hypothetical protein
MNHFALIVWGVGGEAPIVFITVSAAYTCHVVCGVYWLHVVAPKRTALLRFVNDRFLKIVVMSLV